MINFIWFLFHNSYGVLVRCSRPWLVRLFKSESGTQNQKVCSHLQHIKMADIIIFPRRVRRFNKEQKNIKKSIGINQIT
ncbi:hypothetical protein HZS_4406 [Henneguya salminicola]|nr:hypothetical protein HZS_4406 [Henneguya salminicola]